MMQEGYGNIAWQFFVYSTYFIVSGSLVCYITYALFARRKSLRSLYEEGFFLEENASDKEKGHMS